MKTTLLCGLAAFTSSFATAADTADTIFTGGSIITINDAAPDAEALAVKDGKILAVGSKDDVLKTKGDATKMIDLGGRTLVPGFVDAHSHFWGVGIQSISANLLPQPDGPVNSIPQMQKVMREFLANSPVVKQHGVAIGFNYDDSQLLEHRSPTAAELDEVSTTVPIMVIHQSGHLNVLNSAGLAKAGLTAASPNPPGGVIRRKADGKEPDGVLEENAHFMATMKMLPQFTKEEGFEQLAGAQEIYAANGITTAQDGRTDPRALALLAEAAKAGKFKLDVVSYADLEMNEMNSMLRGPLMSPGYTQHFRIGGVKLTFDGSPQGKTAWFTKPYFKVPEGQPDTYNGYPTFTDEKALEWIGKAFKNHWQVLIHANGDAAIEQLIKSVGTAAAEFPGKDRRTVLIHGQYLRADQVMPLKDLEIFPALYPMHTFYWGDWHRDSVAGPVRAEDISPTGWMLKNDMKFSIHSDAPVTFPNSMRILDSAVNRTTRTGKVLGANHRVTPLVALKAMTLWSAWQHFEEKTKGSLEPGKLADLVILDKNPLKIEPATLKDIKVVETIKEGKTVYSAK